MPKVSIIIPLYNAEERIETTLKSVLGQTLRDIEVILVDDGSRDRTVEIARSWEARDERVKLFLNEHNKGVSETRNHGLRRACGEYIRFVDGDDTIPDVSTAEMVSIAERQQADLVIGVMRRESIVNATNFGNTVQLGKQKNIDRYDENLIYTFSVCNKLFKRALIEEHQLRFQPYKHAEDGMFFFQYIQYAQGISGYDKVCYIYNKSEFFETPTATEKLTIDMMEGILDISEKIRALDPNAPQGFIDTFNARILGTTLIGEYYRKIWAMDTDVVPALLKKIRQYWAILPDEQRSTIIKMNQDLPVAAGLGGRDSLLADLQFTIVIGNTVSADHLPRLLQSLYYQRVPSFAVVIHPDLAGAVPAYYSNMENLRIAEHSEHFFDHELAVCQSHAIAFIQDDITFTYETLNAAHVYLRGETEIVSGAFLVYRNGRIEPSDLLEYLYADFATGGKADFPALDEMDRYLSNKIFSVAALRRGGVVFGDDPLAGLDQAKAVCKYSRHRRSRYITDMDDSTVWEGIVFPPVPERFEKYAVHARNGKERISELKPAFRNRLRHRIRKAALFVGEKGVLTGRAREVYDGFSGQKEIAPAALDSWTAAERTIYYSNYRVVCFAHTDAFMKPGLLHEGQTCYFLLNELVRSDDEVRETAAYLETVLREASHRHPRNVRYMAQKTSAYLARNKRVQQMMLETLPSVYRRLLPLRKKTVLFAADEDGKLGLNQRCLFEQLPAGMHKVTEVTGAQKQPGSMRTLLRMVRQLSTAGFVVLEDVYMPLEHYRPRKGQEICQLWHGSGAFKKFANSFNELGVKRIEGHKKYTKAIVSAPLIEPAYAEAFHIPNAAVAATGIPKTDILFDAAAAQDIREDLYKKYPALKGKKLILFAPTRRTRIGNDIAYPYEQLDLEQLYQTLHEEYAFAVKWHPATYQVFRQMTPSAFKKAEYQDFFYDFSEEENIDKLLAVTDVLVTDYSSVAFDYVLLDRPAVFYMPDLEQYQAERGFFYELEEYLYGPVAQDTSALIKAILAGDLYEEERQRVKNTFMDACDGHATEKTMAFLLRNEKPARDASSAGRVLTRAKSDDPVPAAPIQVHVVRDRGGQISVEGVFFSAADSNERFCLESETGERYSPERTAYPKADIHLKDGTVLLRADRFKIMVPKKEAAYFFAAPEEDGPDRIEATFEKTTGLTAAGVPEKQAGTFKVARSGQKLIVRTGMVKKAAPGSLRSVIRTLLHGRIRSARKKYYLRKRQLIQEQKELKDAIALVSIRGNALEDNLSLLREELTGSVRVFAHRRPFSERTMTDLHQCLFENKVVVTDDYMWLYREYPKPAGQKLVQVWHACGAFKKFGVDGTSMFPGVDALTHQYYDLVTVSSEYVRSIYAQAFDISLDKVQALGSPRTDILFDEAKRSAMRTKVLHQHPELAGKQVILYAPTFRDLPGVPRSRFIPRLDFGQLSASLREDQVFVICPHPVMTAQILPRSFSNIIEVRDCSTMEMMMVSDLLVTDYSSVIFEYSLLGKPIVFYCYDFDDYDRDFYLDYEEDLPGELFKTEEELERYLAAGSYQSDDRQERFVEKYMSACDGNSTARIARAIEELRK